MHQYTENESIYSILISHLVHIINNIHYYTYIILCNITILYIITHI